jgi:hypothetical protein
LQPLDVLRTRMQADTAMGLSRCDKLRHQLRMLILTQKSCMLMQSFAIKSHRLRLPQ